MKMLVANGDLLPPTADISAAKPPVYQYSTFRKGFSSLMELHHEQKSGNSSPSVFVGPCDHTHKLRQINVRFLGSNLMVHCPVKCRKSIERNMNIASKDYLVKDEL